MQLTRQQVCMVLFAVGVMPFMVNGWVNAWIYPYPWVFWGFEILSWAFMPVLIFSYLINKQGLRLDDLGIHARIGTERNLRMVVIAAVVLMLLDSPFYSSLRSLSLRLLPGPPFFTYDTVLPANYFLHQFTAIYFALSAGIVEELYYRGLLYKLSSGFSHPARVYMIFSPMLFALSHWENGTSAIFAAWVFGLAAAGIYLRLKNLWPLIAGHIVTDFLWFS